MPTRKNNKRIPLAGGFYDEQSKNLNAQRSVNWYPVGSLEGKTQVALYPTPGATTQLYSTNIHFGLQRPLVWSPVLDKFVAIGDFVLGANLAGGAIKTFSVDETNTANITMYSNFVGSVTPGGRNMPSPTYESVYYLGHDLITTESMVLAVAGAANTSQANCIFALDISNTSNVVAKVAYWEDPIVPTSIAYMKGYVVINHDNSGTTNNDPYRGRFYSNSLATTDLGNVVLYDYDWSKMAYNAGEYTKAVVVNGQYLYVFGETHYEVWYFSGNTAFPWDVIQEATGRFGLFDKNCYASYQDNIFVLGKSENGNYGCYVISGLENKKISTPVIDRILQNGAIVSGGLSPTVMVYEFNGNIFVCFSVKNIDGLSDRGLIYNITTGLWHEQSYETSWVDIHHQGAFVLNDMAAPTGSDYTYALFGSTGTIRLEPDNPTFDGQPLPRFRTTQHISGEDSYVYHDRLRLDIEANSNISHDANVVANIYLQSSDDDGKTWYDYPPKSLSNASYGTISGDKRVEWFRLGRSDDRLYNIYTNANCMTYIAGGFLDATKGYR